MAVDATEVTAWWESFKAKLEHEALDSEVQAALLHMLKLGLSVVEPMIDSALKAKGVNPELVAAGEDIVNAAVDAAGKK